MQRRLKERGQFVPITAILFLVLLGMVGLSIDSGHLYLLSRDEQRTADMAALAGADELKYTQRAQVDYAPIGNPYDNGNIDSPIICTAFADKALQVAALNGSSVYDSANVCTANDKSQCYGSYYSPGGNPAVPTSDGNSLSLNHYDVIFYDTNNHSSSPNACSANESYTTAIELVSPPKATDIGSSSDCLAYKYNCLEVVILTKASNYVMIVFGFNKSTIRATGVGYGL